MPTRPTGQKQNRATMMLKNKWLSTGDGFCTVTISTCNPGCTLYWAVPYWFVPDLVCGCSVGFHPGGPGYGGGGCWPGYGGSCWPGYGGGGCPGYRSGCIPNVLCDSMLSVNIGYHMLNPWN